MADYIFRLKRGQSSSWVDQNIVLAAGEPGVELNTHRMKVGDGVTPWKDLPYTGISADEARAIASETANLSRVIVNSLEEIDITAPNAEKIIYMVPNIEQDGTNTYDEYMIISGSLEAIGTTKTDLLDYVSKEEAFNNRPDWNQHDESALNFIKNRIAYAHKTGKYIDKNIIFQGQDLEFEYVDEENSLQSAWSEDINTKIPAPKLNSYYKIIYDNQEYIGKATSPPPELAEDLPEGMEYIVVGELDWETEIVNSPIAFMYMNYPAANIRVFGISISNDTTLFHNIQVIEMEEEEIIKKIDKKFLYQPDWNQNDPTAADYIKNRICYIDPTKQFGEETLWLDTTILSEEARFLTLTDKKLINGATYKININGQEQHMKASIFDIGGMFYGITLGGIMSIEMGEYPVIIFYLPYQPGISEELGVSTDATIIVATGQLEGEYSIKIHECGIDYEISPNIQTVNFIFPADDSMAREGFNPNGQTLSLKEDQEYLVTINNRDYYYQGTYVKWSSGDYEVDGICLGSPDTFMMESNNPIMISSGVYHKPSNKYIDAGVFIDFAGLYEGSEFNLSITIKEIFNNNSYKKIDANFIPNADWEATISEPGYIKNKPFYPAENCQKIESILFKGHPDDLESNFSIDSSKQYWLSINGIKSELYQGFSMPYPYEPSYQIYGFGDMEYIFDGAAPKAGFYVIVFPAALICDISVTDYNILNQKYGISNHNDFYQSLIEIGEISEVGLKKKTLDNQFISEDVPTLAAYSSLGKTLRQSYNNASTVEQALYFLTNSDCDITTKPLDVYDQISDITITKNKIYIVNSNGQIAFGDKIDYAWEPLSQQLSWTFASAEYSLCSNLDNIIIAYQPQGGKKYISHNEGETWNLIESNYFSTEAAKFIYKYNKFFCFVNNTILYSANGINWTQITYDGSIVANDILQSGDLYIICGNNGKIIYSNGFIIWHELSNFTENHLQAIIFNGEQYLLYTNVGEIYISQDGINWTKNITSIDNTSNVDKLIIGNNSYMIKTAYSTNSRMSLWYSEDGFEWKKINENNYMNSCFDKELNCYYVVNNNNFQILQFKNATNVVRQKDLLPLKQQINNLFTDSDTSLNYLVLKDQKSGLNYIVEIHNGIIVTYSKYVDMQILNQPIKTIYDTNDVQFNPEGMVVIVIGEDGTQTIIDNYNYYKGNLKDLKTPSVGIFDFEISYNVGNTKLKSYIPLTFKDLASLQDFNYQEVNGYYEITDWKQTLNGKLNTTDLIIPSGNLIKI